MISDRMNGIVTKSTTSSVTTEPQTITASAASNDVVDLGGVKDPGIGPKPMRAWARVTADFATCDSLTVKVQGTAAAAADGTPDWTTSGVTKDLMVSQTVLTAALKAGKVFTGLGLLPTGIKVRWLRLYFTIAGSNATTGAVIGGFTSMDGAPANDAVTI
jgi:hypothetical protein